jgi:hypothetical protein
MLRGGLSFWIAQRHALYFDPMCNGCATGDSLIEAPHAFLQTRERHVQLRRGLFQALMPKQVLDMVQRHVGLVEPASCLVPEVVAVQVDRA